MRAQMRAARVAKQLTAKDAAERLGVHVNALLRWETGEAEPMASNLIALARLYDVAPEVLMQQSVKETNHDQREQAEKDAADR